MVCAKYPNRKARPLHFLSDGIRVKGVLFFFMLNQFYYAFMLFFSYPLTSNASFSEKLHRSENVSVAKIESGMIQVKILHGILESRKGT